MKMGMKCKGGWLTDLEMPKCKREKVGECGRMREWEREKVER